MTFICVKWIVKPEYAAAEAHVTRDHFRKAQEDLPQYDRETPLVRDVLMEGNHWDALGEFEIEIS